jgi:biopolymer transport protein ExbD
MRILLILIFLVTTTVAEARMYQWTEPGVETTQLSGKPPAWYRSVAGGPRVFVFDKGRLIDDTAVEVSDELRQRMRQQAFVLAEEDRQKANEKMVKAQELKQIYKKSGEDESKPARLESSEEKDLGEKAISEALFPEENKQEEQDDISEKSLDELRAMILDWEASQTESAKQALE